MAIKDELQLGRAKNAVLTLLEQKLVVPKIFLDAEWAGHHVDVLAVDRAGVGDVHVVLLLIQHDSPLALFVPESVQAVEVRIEYLKSIPAQYRYVALVDPASDRRPGPLAVPQELLEKSFASDGLGRIGILSVHASIKSEPVATLELKPERFRASVMKLADEYVQRHTADWEVRA